jgi:hypothetical protein
MEICKLIQYEIGKVNVPKIVNEFLDKEKENRTIQYYIFSQTDVIDNAQDPNTLGNMYVNLLTTFNMPFGYYSYYGRFNRVLPTITNTPNPVYVFNIKNTKVDVTNQLAPGFLIVDMDMLNKNNIRLDETYPEIFYLQDLAEKCFKAGLWKSNCFFFDIHESWKLFKNQNNDGRQIDIKKFTEEKNRYTEKKPEYKPVNFFIDELKKIYSTEIKEEKEEKEEVK